MIFINKNARKWVLDFTLAALAISFILTDVRAITVDLAYTDMFALDYMEIILPVVLVITGSAASYAKKSSAWTDILMMVCVGLSRGVISLSSSILPWIFSGYLIGLAILKMNKATMQDIDSRKDGTLYTALALIVTIILALNGSLSAEAFNIKFGYEVLVIGLILYAVFRRTREVELDFGMMFGWLTDAMNSNSGKVWNPDVNAWVISEEEEKSDLSRYSGIN